MRQPVTPYIWQYNPQDGATAGARQDYGSVINWLSASPRLFERIKSVNLARNAYDEAEARANRTGLNDVNINRWGPGEVYQPPGSSFVPALADDWSEATDFARTARGQQLAGGSLDYHLGDGRRYRKLTRDALPFPANWEVFEDGRWRMVPRRAMTGGAADALASYPMILPAAEVAANELRPPELGDYRRPGAQLQGRGLPSQNLLLRTEGSRAPHYGGIAPLQFMREFPPVVYHKPFSGPLAYFPKEFSPLFDPDDDPRRTSALTLQYAQ